VRYVWVIFLVLVGCATPAQKSAMDSWMLKPGWANATTFHDITLKGRDGKLYKIQGAHIENLKIVLIAIEKQSHIYPEVVLVADDTSNAFATTKDEQQIIGVTLAMLNNIGLDRDAIATTLGHELAHLQLKHGDIRKRRTESAKGLGDVLGLALALVGVPMGGTIANVGVGVVTTAYSRDEEREADILGLRWAMNAGYSACGSARTINIFKAQGATAPAPFLASHPGHDERIERANQAAIKETGQGC